MLLKIFSYRTRNRIIVAQLIYLNLIYKGFLYIRKIYSSSYRTGSMRTNLYEKNHAKSLKKKLLQKYILLFVCACSFACENNLLSVCRYIGQWDPSTLSSHGYAETDLVFHMQKDPSASSDNYIFPSQPSVPWPIIAWVMSLNTRLFYDNYHKWILRKRVL